jgi:2-hydroxychromene-2-carboxylate isomerase
MTAVDAGMTRTFALSFDYRCPWARIVHEHVMEGLRAGAEWDVTFIPFSLAQVHVEEGQTPVWARPDEDSGLLALQASLAVRDTQPTKFLAVHHGLFEHRHGRAGELRDRDELSAVLADAGADVEKVWAEVESGRPLATAEKEHTSYVESHNMWGVPTFIVGDRAVFVRLMSLPDGDGELAISTVNRILDQIDWPMVNEFKHTSIPR